MTKRKIKDFLRFVGAVLCFPIYIPHLLVYSLGGKMS